MKTTETTKAQHTPGPWMLRIHKNNSDIADVVVRAPSGLSGHVETYEERWIVVNVGVSDGRLIAAAPEMKRELEMAKYALQDFLEDICDRDYLLDQLTMIEALLKKIEGR